MPKQKVIITGHSGMLGQALVKLLAEKADLFGLSLEKTNLKQGIYEHKIDITDFSKARDLLLKIKPDLVIHTAALTDVDRCESEPELAKKVNTDATANLAKTCQELQTPLVYVSTDFVFSGEAGNYKETDKPEPINVYAKTKLTGEKAIQELAGDYIITRNTLYGWNTLPGRQSLVELLLRANKEGKIFKPFVDHIFTPVYAETLAEVIYDLYQDKKWGIWHIGTSNSYNKFEFAKKVATVFGLDVNLIRPGKSEDFKTGAPRPKDVSLNTEKLSSRGRKIDLEKDLFRMKSNKQVF